VRGRIRLQHKESSAATAVAVSFRGGRHASHRAALVRIDRALLLVVIKDAANPAVGLHALGPHLGQTLFVRQVFVLHEFLRGIMQVLQDRLDFGLLIAGKITVAKYMARHKRPPSQTWRTFLKNHTKDLVSVDFFVVPTIAFQLLFVFVILDHDRRRPLHFAITANPTAEWTARQLLEAFPWDSAPRYLLRDRDGIDGEKLSDRNHSVQCRHLARKGCLYSMNWNPTGG
jgi:hypothetical protein